MLLATHGPTRHRSVSLPPSSTTAAASCGHANMAARAAPRSARPRCPVSSASRRISSSAIAAFDNVGPRGTALPTARAPDAWLRLRRRGLDVLLEELARLLRPDLQ